MKIIGVSGTNGSGKDTVSHFLAEKGWLFISASGDLIIPELQRRGLPIERKNMADLTTEWRKQSGSAPIIDKAVEAFNSKSGKYIGLVVSSLRHPGEADRIHELGGQVVWTDASAKVRYERIYNRGQGVKDQKTFEQFLAEEQAEMSHSGDEATLNMAAVKDRADIFLDNNQNDLEIFKNQVEQALSYILA